MIRRLGPLTGKRIYFGYDRYVLTELGRYQEALAPHGQLIERVDPDDLHYLKSASLTCSLLQDDQLGFGVLCCYTGMGMSIAANKFRGVYAARCVTVEDAELARTVNNANVLCLAAQSGLELNRAIIDAFVSTPYAGRKIDQLEGITTLEMETPPAAPVFAARNVRRFA